MANRLKTCLVLGERSCIYLTLDGTLIPDDSLPGSTGYVAGKLLSSFDFFEDDELRDRAERLKAFIDSHRHNGYLFGDLQKGGRQATEEELKQFSCTQENGIPEGLVYCGRCGRWRGQCLDPNPRFQNMLMKVHCRCENDNLCARCGQPLYEFKLNANYFDPENGQIWHVPAFCAFGHVCRLPRMSPCPN